MIKRLWQTGDTLVEVLIVIAIMGLVIAGAFVAADSNLKGVRQSEERTEALKYAESQLEQLRATPVQLTGGVVNPNSCPIQPALASGTNDPVSGYNCVMRIQYFLKALVSPALVVDGNFGPATQAAVISFQTNQSISPTGNVDSATWDALESNARRTTIFCMNGGAQEATNSPETAFGALPALNVPTDDFTMYRSNCTFTNGISYYVGIDYTAASSAFTVHVRWNSIVGKPGALHNEVVLSEKVNP